MIKTFKTEALAVIEDGEISCSTDGQLNIYLNQEEAENCVMLIEGNREANLKIVPCTIQVTIK